MTARSTKGDKKRAAIYREAARRIERKLNYCCCYAIRRITGNHKLGDEMREVFAARRIQENRWSGHWMVEIGEMRYGESAEVQNRRILALCFMAAMVEAGDA